MAFDCPHTVSTSCFCFFSFINREIIDNERNCTISHQPWSIWAGILPSDRLRIWKLYLWVCCIKSRTYSPSHTTCYVILIISFSLLIIIVADLSKFSHFNSLPSLLCFDLVSRFPRCFFFYSKPFHRLTFISILSCICVPGLVLQLSCMQIFMSYVLVTKLFFFRFAISPLLHKYLFLSIFHICVRIVCFLFYVLFSRIIWYKFILCSQVLPYLTVLINIKWCH